MSSVLDGKVALKGWPVADTTFFDEEEAARAGYHTLIGSVPQCPRRGIRREEQLASHEPRPRPD